LNYMRAAPLLAGVCAEAFAFDLPSHIYIERAGSDAYIYFFTILLTSYVFEQETPLQAAVIHSKMCLFVHDKRFMSFCL
jgi:hypothetical protein